jgi:anaerobic selenocysteine-containing dehydrogenase
MNQKNNKELVSYNRRDFLKKSALLGLAAVFNPLSEVIASKTVSEELIDDAAAPTKKNNYVFNHNGYTFAN